MVLLRGIVHVQAIAAQRGDLVGEMLWERFNGGRAGTLWYYRALVDAFRKVGSPLADELDRVVSELEHVAAT